DDYFISQHLNLMLTNMDYLVSGITGSGETAMKLIQTSRPDIILIDVKLSGGIDGIDVAGWINKEHGIPVIFITAYSDDETIQRIKSASPYGYLMKPVTPDGLKAAIEICYNKFLYDINIKQSEKRYTGIVETLPVWLCRFVPGDMSITFANYLFSEGVGAGRADL